MRKQLLFIAIAALAFTQGFSQSVQPATISSSAYRPPVTIFGPNNPDMSFRGTADIQDQFLSRTWTEGHVKFKNGQWANSLLLLFDVHNNKLYFMDEKDHVPMEFVYPIEEFVIGLIVGKDTTNLFYRSSYPAVNANTTETFYEVLVDGKIQLLRCRAKNVGMYKDSEQPEQKRFTEKEQLYIFADGKMTKIKKDKDEVLNALPEYAKKIEQILDEEKLKLKHEEGLRKLVVALNKL